MALMYPKRLPVASAVSPPYRPSTASRRKRMTAGSLRRNRRAGLRNRRSYSRRSSIRSRQLFFSASGFSSSSFSTDSASSGCFFAFGFPEPGRRVQTGTPRTVGRTVRVPASQAARADSSPNPSASRPPASVRSSSRSPDNRMRIGTSRTKAISVRIRNTSSIRGWQQYGRAGPGVKR